MLHCSCSSSSRLSQPTSDALPYKYVSTVSGRVFLLVDTTMIGNCASEALCIAQSCTDPSAPLPPASFARGDGQQGVRDRIFAELSQPQRRDRVRLVVVCVYLAAACGRRGALLNGSIVAGPTWTNVSGARRRIRCPGRAARLIAIDGGAEAIGRLVLHAVGCVHRSLSLAPSVHRCLASRRRRSRRRRSFVLPPPRKTNCFESWIVEPPWKGRQRDGQRGSAPRGSRGRKPPGGGAGGGAPCPGGAGGRSPLAFAKADRASVGRAASAYCCACCNVIPPWKFYA